jgi:Protein of unknown function (DUF3667)
MSPDVPISPPDTTTSHCRNCGAVAQGTYCPACGQETQVKLPTARVFLREAMGRYVALDGRLWRTLAALLFRPGFLTREYFAGRRRRFIRPARLFLVLSLALFAAIRFFAQVPVIDSKDPPAQKDTKANAKSHAKPTAEEPEEEQGGKIALRGFALHLDPDLNLDVEGGNEPWTQELNRRFARFNHLTGQEKSEQVFAGAVRYGPYAMFVLMPLFALLLQFAWVGGARRYPNRPRRYAENLVFAAHTHAFFFLVVVLVLAIPYAPARFLLGVWWVCYGLWATRVVYGGSWFGLLWRALFVGFFYLLAFAVAMAGLLLSAVLLR